MADNTTLNVLGCVPSLLNILFELADEAQHIKSFNILKNIPVDITDHFLCSNDWHVNVHNCYEEKCRFSPDDYYALSVVGVKSKEIVFDAFKHLIQMDIKQFINLIHPTAYVSKSVNLHYGLQVESLSTIAACTSIGFGVNIKRNCNIGHHCEIGDFVTINPGVTVSSFVKVGNKTMLGSGTSVKDNITIGENTTIGVGSVVVKDIPSNTVAFGNPCKVYKWNDIQEDNKN